MFLFSVGTTGGGPDGPPPLPRPFFMFFKLHTLLFSSQRGHFTRWYLHWQYTPLHSQANSSPSSGSHCRNVCITKNNNNKNKTEKICHKRIMKIWNKNDCSRSNGTRSKQKGSAQWKNAAIYKLGQYRQNQHSRGNPPCQATKRH